MNELPVIELSVRGMKHSVIKALTDHETEVSAEVRRSVEAWCQPDNIRRVVAAEVGRTLDALVREEVDRFYRFGAGRAVIRDAVLDTLTPTETSGE